MMISFVVPAHNEEVLIEKCLRAILAETSCTKCEAEIIVVNNASSDNTRHIALSVPGVTVVDEPIKGLVNARRAGYMASHGELIANIDADTIIPQGWLDKVLTEFAKAPNMVALSGPYIYYGVPERVRFVAALFYKTSFVFYSLNRLFKVGSMIQGGNFVVRRSAMQAIGGFNMDFSFYGEDTDLARRLSKVGDVKFSFQLPAFSSGRRLAGEGLLMTAWHYSINFIWATFMKRPYTYTSVDYRDECL